MTISKLDFDCLQWIGYCSSEPHTLACVSKQWKMILAPSSRRSILNTCRQYDDLKDLVDAAWKTYDEGRQDTSGVRSKKSLRTLIETVWKDASMVLKRDKMPLRKRVLFDPQELIHLVSRMNAERIITLFRKASPQNPKALDAWCALERNNAEKVDVFCKRMRQLDLSEKDLVDLPDIIGRLSSLFCLLLKGNELTSLPVGVCSMHKLRKLDLRENRIAKLPNEVENLTELTWVNLNDNQLRELPPQVGCWSKIERLFLRRNQLKTLPPEVGCWQEVREVYLSFNPLETLPDTVTKWDMVEEIDLSGCRLKHLPDELDKQETSFIEKTRFVENEGFEVATCTMTADFWPRLTTLSLRSNCFTAFPMGICEMMSLRDLDLSHNAIREVPAAIGNLAQLQYLNLSHNKLPNLCKEVTKLTRLAHLNILNNCIPNDVTLPFSVYSSTQPALVDAQKQLHHYGCQIM